MISLLITPIVSVFYKRKFEGADYCECELDKAKAEYQELREMVKVKYEHRV